MSNIAIDVKNITKYFTIHHEKNNTIFEALTGIFNPKRNYEKIVVLDEVSFSVKKGEVLGIIGRNGIGKTTLLRILSGIYKPDLGTVTINGKLIPFLGLGLGFQPEMTAKANVIQYGRLLGFSKKEIKEKEKEIIKFAELEKFEDTKLKNFSSGMAARLAFSTAIQVNPDIILIDEVLSVGDHDFQKKSHERFSDFKKSSKSIVLVSHDLETVKQNCDRVIFLHDGKILAIGSSDEVVTKYLEHFGESSTT